MQPRTWNKRSDVYKEPGNIVGEYQLQFVRVTEWDSSPLQIFKELGGKILPATKIPERSVKTIDKFLSNFTADTDSGAQTQCEVVDICSHPILPKLAIAIKNSGVSFYNQKTREWEYRTLSHPKMNETINNVEYNPLGHTLGACCESGVCIWRFRPLRTRKYGYDPQEKESFIEDTFMILMPHPGAGGLKFSPCGRCFASWAGCDMRIWDANSTGKDETFISLKNSSETVLSVDWTQSSLITNHGSSVLIYNTDNWSFRRYSSEKPLVAGICHHTSPGVFLLSTNDNLHWVATNKQQTKFGDSVPFLIQFPHDKDKLKVQKVFLSPCNSRIILLFDPSDNPLSRRLAVIAVENSTFLPIGFLNGPEDSAPVSVSFQKQTRGSLMSSVWSNGNLVFHHLFS